MVHCNCTVQLQNLYMYDVQIRHLKGKVRISANTTSQLPWPTRRPPTTMEWRLVAWSWFATAYAGSKCGTAASVANVVDCGLQYAWKGNCICRRIRQLTAPILVVQNQPQLKVLESVQWMIGWKLRVAEVMMIMSLFFQDIHPNLNIPSCSYPIYGTDIILDVVAPQAEYQRHASLLLTTSTTPSTRRIHKNPAFQVTRCKRSCSGTPSIFRQLLRLCHLNLPTPNPYPLS